MNDPIPPGSGRRFSIPDGLLSSKGGAGADSSPEPKKAAGGKSGGGKRVLLVDDEPAVRMAVKQLLTFHGYEVVEAEGGAEALKQYQAGKFSCVITDNLMPFMRGPELAARIRAIDPAQHIVMFSASADRLTQDGMPWDSLIVKPFGTEELMAAISAPGPNA